MPGKRDAGVRALSALERTLRATMFLGGDDFTIADIFFWRGGQWLGK